MPTVPVESFEDVLVRPVSVPESERVGPRQWMPYDVGYNDAAAYISFREGYTASHVDTSTPEGVAFRLLVEEAEAAYRTLVRVSAEMEEFAPNNWQ